MRPLTLLSILITLAGILITCGLLFIYSSSSVFALELSGSSTYYLTKQLIGFFSGIVLGAICSQIPLSFIQRWSPLVFIALLLATFATCIPFFSLAVHGSSRWLKLGPFALQPSEFLKMSFILYLATFFSKKQPFINSLHRTFVPFIIIVCTTCGLLLLQPDFGQAVTLALSGILLYFIALGSLTYVLRICLVALPLIILLIWFKPYRLRRIMIFLNPWKDPQGTGFQIIQSLIAIGSGHITGLGLGQSRQKFFYLPMLHTDFIFSIIAEEIGFIGISAILFLYFFLIMGGIKLALMMKNHFAFFACMGFFMLIALEAFINIGVATALLPTKGLSLPFISYGKSSLIAHMTMFGVIWSCVKEV